MKRLKSVSVVLLFILLVASACSPAANPIPDTSDSQATEPAAAQPPAATQAPADGSDPALSSDYSKAILEDMNTPVDTSVYKKEGPYVIAVAGRDPSNGFGNTFQISIKAYGDELLEKGILKSPLLVTATNDASQQISEIENFIQQKPDALVVSPLGRAASVAVIKSAVDAGIPVVLCADGIEGEDFTTRVDINLYEVGYRTAEGLANLLDGQGKIVLFHGIAGVDAAETERAGALEALKSYPDIEVIAEEYAQWNIATAKQKMEALLAANPQIDGVWAGGGEMALGSVLAFADANKTQPKYGLVNVPNGFLRLADQHKLQFVAAPDPPAMSRHCLQTAVDVLQGKPVQKFIHLSTLMDGVDIYDHTNFMQYYVPELNDDFIPPATVDLQHYADGGFGRE
jgi:ABC-type sugar transport system substrate-binding protein